MNLFSVLTQEHIKQIDPDNYLGLGPHSIQGVQAGVVVWTPGGTEFY